MDSLVRLVWRIALAATAGLALLTAAGGCAAPLPIDATDYRIRLELDPPQHHLTGHAVVRCVASQHPPRGRGMGAEVRFALHPDLQICNVQAHPVRVRQRHIEPNADTNGLAPAIHCITLDRWAETFTLTFDYAGQLQQDVAAGEHRGEIHNFTVNAHIGEDGVYLGGAGHWYPQPHQAALPDADRHLARYDIEVAPIENYVFVAGADARTAPQPGAPLHARSTFPQTDMAVVGGQYRVWNRDVDGVRFAILLHADDASAETLQRRAELFLDAAVEYLGRYQPLLGPYPFDEFTIVENFFSSGFAFPTFTLLGPMVIAMEDRALRHGYLDHELLHSWWGNALYVDPADGNWCEALASFGANLYGYVLDGDAEGARKHRRDICNALSRIPADKDQPLATFGQPGGAGRTIGYQKGTMVFHMLSRRMNPERFWAAIRALTSDYIGRYVNWDVIRTTCEREIDQDLGDFFDQWVRNSGSPQFTLAGGEAGDAPRSLIVEIAQETPTFTLDLPLRVHPEGGEPFDVTVAVSGPSTRATLTGIDLPVDLELDPDFHVARKLATEEIMPTLAGVHRGDACLVVAADDDLTGGYRVFIDDIIEKRAADTTTTRSPATVAAEDLSAGTLVIVGDAVRSPAVADLLGRSECPITWTDDGFSIEGVAYNAPGHAVLCTFRHPDRPEYTVTIYQGNSPAALSNAGIVWFYGNSLLVFQTPTGPGTIAAGYTAVVKRIDFERSHRIHVSARMADAADQ